MDMTLPNKPLLSAFDSAPAAHSHWEIAWSTLEPLSAEEVQRAVEAIARLGCSLTNFAVEAVDSRYVTVRHRKNDEFLLEFGFAADAPQGPAGSMLSRGLIDAEGAIAWNWCCTSRAQPETGLIIRKWRQVQAIAGDKLLIWDDDGVCHWSWGSCPIEQSGHDPQRVIAAHLRQLPPALDALAS